MKKTKKIALIIATVILMAVCFVFGVSAERAVVASGDCGAEGDNVTWVLYDDGEIVFSGEGEIESFFEIGLPNEIRDKIITATIEEGVTNIPDGLFSSCYSLEEIDIADSVTSIGRESFYHCENLKNFEMPDSIVSLGKNAFRGCYKLEKIKFSNSLAFIGWQAFRECGNLRRVELPSSLTTLESEVFIFCSNLEVLTVSKLVDTFDSAQVAYCEKLKAVTVLNSNCNINSVVGYAFPEITIFSGYAGSTTEKFATDYNYHFIPLDGENAGEILNHQFPMYWSTVLSATCAAEGLKIKTCRTCGMSESETIEKIAHSYGDWKTVIEASCSVEGLKTKKCVTCGISETETISKLAHSFSEWETIIEPDCTRKGLQTKECSACDKLEMKTINANGHKYDKKYTVDIEATCITDGSKSRHCTVCDAKTDITIMEATNEHRYIDVTVTPNGDVQSYTVHVCAVCDYSYKDEPVIPEEPTEPDEPETPDEPSEKPCDCNCHAGGIKAFFFNLVNFFAKIFDKNARVCACGKAH